jgi:hypothetical protein
MDFIRLSGMTCLDHQTTLIGFQLKNGTAEKPTLTPIDSMEHRRIGTDTYPSASLRTMIVPSLTLSG